MLYKFPDNTSFSAMVEKVNNNNHNMYGCEKKFTQFFGEIGKIIVQKRRTFLEAEMQKNFRLNVIIRKKKLHYVLKNSLPEKSEFWQKKNCSITLAGKDT